MSPFFLFHQLHLQTFNWIPYPFFLNIIMHCYVKLLMFFFNFLRTTRQFLRESDIFDELTNCQRIWYSKLYHVRETKWFLNDLITLLEDSLRVYTFDQMTEVMHLKKEQNLDYINAPILTLCMIKYDHSKSCLEAKVTDIVVFEQKNFLIVWYCHLWLSLIMGRHCFCVPEGDWWSGPYKLFAQ